MVFAKLELTLSVNPEISNVIYFPLINVNEQINYISSSQGNKDLQTVGKELDSIGYFTLRFFNCFYCC